MTQGNPLFGLPRRQVEQLELVSRQFVDEAAFTRIGDQFYCRKPLDVDGPDLAIYAAG